MERQESTDGSEAAQREGETALQQFQAHAQGLSRGKCNGNGNGQVNAEQRTLGTRPKLRHVLRGLGINPDAQLKKCDVTTILRLLGLELTAYQQAALNQDIDRAHHYDASKLHAWLRLNKSFVLYLEVSRYRTTQVPKSLKQVRELRQSCLVSPMCGGEFRASKRSENLTPQTGLLPVLPQKALSRSKLRSRSKVSVARCSVLPTRGECGPSLKPSCLMEGEGRSNGRDDFSRLRARLRDCIRRQRAEYARNAEVLAQTHEYCQKLRKHRSVLLIRPSFALPCAH
jgi:hypothetical protein